MATLSGVRGPSVTPPGNFLISARAVFSSDAPFCTSPAMIPVPCSVGAPSFFASVEERNLPAALTASGTALTMSAYCPIVWRSAAPSSFAAEGGSRGTCFSCFGVTRCACGSTSSSACAMATPPCPSSAAWWSLEYIAICPVFSPSISQNCHSGRSRSIMPSCSFAVAASSCAMVPGLGRTMCLMW